MRSALISGITSGTFGSMRKADELSTTTAPAFTAMGVNFLEMLPPAENSAISTPSNELSLSSSIMTLWPRKSIVLPADRALASALSLPTRKARLSMVAMNSAPTAPVTPAMATTGLLFTGSLHQAIKKPRTFSGGASVQMMRSSSYARTPPEAPEGFAVLVARLVVVIMARAYAGDFDRRQRVSDQKSRSTRLNGTPLLRNKLTHEPSQSLRSCRGRRPGAHRPADDAAWCGANPCLHAGRHRGRHEGHALARGTRRRHRYRARQYLPFDAAAGRRAHRRARGPADLHRLERPDADRFRRLPGDVAGAVAQGQRKRGDLSLPYRRRQP